VPENESNSGDLTLAIYLIHVSNGPQGAHPDVHAVFGSEEGLCADNVNVVTPITLLRSYTPHLLLERLSTAMGTVRLTGLEMIKYGLRAVLALSDEAVDDVDSRRIVARHSRLREGMPGMMTGSQPVGGGPQRTIVH
jgi:hypothetical protein